MRACRSCRAPLGEGFRPEKDEWAVKDSNLRSRRQLIYSQPPLATWVTAHSFLRTVAGS
jgi:hypothetical protein